MQLANEVRNQSIAPQPSLPQKSTSTLLPTTAHEIDRETIEDGTSQSAEYLTLAARATNDAVRDWDVKSGKLRWPQGLESLLGYATSLSTCEIDFWQHHVHPEDRPRIATSIREALSGADHWSGEYRFRRADGAYAQLLERATIVRNGGAQAIRFVGSLMDITARKQLQDQLCHSQKMEAFGQLASGVAHDFNNFLTTILGYSDLLLCEPAVKGQIAAHLGEIRNAADRASALTAQLLAFSRKHPMDARVLEVNTLLARLDRSLLPLLGENISVDCDLQSAKGGVFIKVDPGQITQIILNLVVNARDAMPTGGCLTLATGNLHIAAGASPNGSSLELAPGDYVSIRVTDNGSGMTDEVKVRLFEPFFTTKHDAQRSGLGLATSYGILRQSGGDIRVQSELGKGTTVTIYIPKVPAPPPPSYKRPAAKKAPTGTETVLVLEDDIGVRHISVRVLRGLGYDVIEAANSDDAQRLITQTADRKIHLLLTDIVMPHMSGRDFAEWLRKTSPRTKVVFISGYLDESSQGSTPGRSGMFFLPKPFDPGQLALKVREALDFVAR
ncbi:MAG: PAS domain-containing protein [Chthoniobacterales bacterium]|nr:PAS domain-containing protein [Chthoniobacterales bacterium]